MSEYTPEPDSSEDDEEVRPYRPVDFELLDLSELGETSGTIKGRMGGVAGDADDPYRSSMRATTGLT